jgi:hypothetical protein
MSTKTLTTEERAKINETFITCPATLHYCRHCDDYFELHDVEHEWWCGSCSLCSAFTPLSTLGHRGGFCDDCYSNTANEAFCKATGLKKRKRISFKEEKKQYKCSKCLEPKKNHSCTQPEGIQALSPLKKTTL